MPKLSALPHLLLPTLPETPRFTSPLAGGGGTRTKSQDRKTHGNQLKDEYLTAIEDPRREHALRLEFESEPGFDLHLKSLDPNASIGVELLNVRVDGKVIKATVLVERGRFGYFLQIFEDYLTKTRGKKEGPANKTLVDSIAHVRRASVSSLWTDQVEPFPTSPQPLWWEAWIRKADGALAQFRATAQQLGIELSEYPITFIDRQVVNIRATIHQLSTLLETAERLAELRHPKLSTAEWMQLSPKEQHEWSKDLLQRVKFPEGVAPVVCLLDTGVTRAHPLLEKSLPPSAWHSVDAKWGKEDLYGHGTYMAGLALFGDLGAVLASAGPVPLTHALESVKLIPEPGEAHNKEAYGAVTQEAIARAEASAPKTTRVVCLTVTSTHGRERGRPTSWSAALDDAAFGTADEERRLICVSAGDADQENFGDYPESNLTDSVHDPAQAWNALTVGAIADRDTLIEPDFQDWKLVAPLGGLCPSSTTSPIWDDAWPIKPEIVLPGGNAAIDASGKSDFPDSLCLLSTYHVPQVRPFTTTGETSAAVALASRMAARLHARYPRLWPETVRALIVHSAEWTSAMRDWLPKTKQGNPKKPKRTDLRRMLRIFGYGVPSEEEAFSSASDCLTLIKQNDLQPYDRDKSRLVTKDMHLYELPWPSEELLALGEAQVEMRVTLSYFVQPLPGERGYGQNQRHRYASHGLRFDMKTGVETPAQFGKRVNKAMREEQEPASSQSDSSRWMFGSDLRSGGSLHHDRWTGPAAELAAKNFIAVYPVVGWWRERPRFERFTAKARYALVVSIRTPELETDIYTPVAVKLGVPIVVPSS